MASARKHVVQRYGRAYQLRIRTEEDLARLDEFGVHHWIATAAPVSAFQGDPRFFAFLDYDGNGRIRSDEVLRALRWLFKVLKSRSRLLKREGVVYLADLDTTTPEGQNLHAGALRLLKNTNRDESAPITLADVRDKKKLLMQSGSNGDGVVPPGVIDDPHLSRYAQDIIDTVGGVDDASGVKGVSEELVKRFHAEAEGYLAWMRQSQPAPGETTSPILPLGDRTAAAYDAFNAVREKVDEFFAQCRLVRIDPVSAPFMRIPEARLKELRPADGAALDALALEAPLQSPTADDVLRLDQAINPAHADRIESFRTTTLETLLGGPVVALTRAAWEDVKARFAPHAKWLAERKGEAVARIGLDRVRTYHEGEVQGQLLRLIDEDGKVADEIKHIEDIERLLLYQIHFARFLDNFVNLSEVFDPNVDSMVDMGTVVMGGYLFNLVLRVSNRATHAAIARNGGIFLVYLEATRQGTADRFEVVCPVTRGRPETLFVGKRGVLIDVNGIEWDVRVVELVVQPISVKQAVLAPFRRAMQFIEGKVEGLSTTREKEMETGLGKRIEETEKAGTRGVQSLAAGTSAAAPAAAPTDGARRRDMLIGGSIAVAALGSAWAFIAKTLTQLGWMEIVIALAGSALVVVVPTSIVAILKLRRRNLGALFEAGEWAINEQLKISARLSRLLTQRPTFPDGTVKERHDALLKAARTYRQRLRSVIIERD